MESFHTWTFESWLQVVCGLVAGCLRVGCRLFVGWLQVVCGLVAGCLWVGCRLFVGWLQDVCGLVAECLRVGCRMVVGLEMFLLVFEAFFSVWKFVFNEKNCILINLILEALL